MMGLGWQELAIILVIVVIIFGAGKLPEIGSGLGKGIRGFKEESGLDMDGKKSAADKAIDKATSDTSSSLTSKVDDAKDRVSEEAKKAEKSVRADEI